jgi:hypothetical protein
MYYNKPLRWLAKFLMPDSRPVDNLKLRMDDPQEEEISLANLEVRSFYHFLYFPLAYYKVKKLSLLMEDMTPGELKRWQRSYWKIIRKSTLNRGGEQLLSKNPSNIFRIRILRAMFPDAKFIYLYRNPYKTLTSYSLFFYEIIEGVGFQKISMEQLYEYTEDLFGASLRAYEQDKGEIPPQNLFEVKYEDFIKDPIGYTEEIYRQFGLELGNDTRARFNDFLMAYKEHESSQYEVPEEIIKMVNSNFMDHLKERGYEVRQSSLG